SRPLNAGFVGSQAMSPAAAITGSCPAARAPITLPPTPGTTARNARAIAVRSVRSRRGGGCACAKEPSPAVARGPEPIRRRSVRAFPGEDHRDRLREDEEVIRERPVLDVEEVETHVLVEGELAAAAHLPEARDTRGNLQAVELPVL